jgi:predicted DNA-binding transcriptional regulator AlpA
MNSRGNGEKRSTIAANSNPAFPMVDRVPDPLLRGTPHDAAKAAVRRVDMSDAASKLCFTIREFCALHGISRSKFYELAKEGVGPALMRVGGRSLISAEAARAWRRLMESNSREACLRTGSDIAANLARLQADMAQAKGIVEAGSREIERSVGIAKSALGALGITLSVGFFAKWIEGSYEAQAGMLRLAQTAGTTVEVFSSLRPVMKNSQTDAEEVAKGMQKLAKSMAESGDGTTKAAKVFDVLKVSVTDATGALRPTQDVMRELGGKLMSMRDQTLAVAFAQEVLGKAGANLLPFLYELARTGELQAKVTTEQARAAKEYEDNLNRLKSSSEQYRNHVANELLPTLNSCWKS